MPSTIACPNCQSQIAIDEVLTAQVTTQLRAEMEAEIRAKNSAVEEEKRKLVAERLAVDKARADLDTKVQAELEKQRGVILAEAVQAAETKLTVELRDQKSQIDELTSKLLIRLTHLFAAFDATVPEQYAYVNRDDRRVFVSEGMMFDIDDQLEEVLPEVFCQRIIIHDDYQRDLIC